MLHVGSGRETLSPQPEPRFRVFAAKPNEKQWLQEKQRAVVDARVQEKRTTDMKQKKAAADIYGRDEIYQRGGGGGRGRGKGRKGGSGGGAHVRLIIV